MSGNRGHYQCTMTPHNDPCMCCHEHQVRFLLKHKTSAMDTALCTSPFITLCDDHHAWTDQNSLTGIGKQ